jgi:hypothetical protein
MAMNRVSMVVRVVVEERRSNLFRRKPSGELFAGLVRERLDIRSAYIYRRNIWWQRCLVQS